MFTFNLRKLSRKNSGSRQTARPQRRKVRPTFKPELEVLEERSLLSVGSPYATQSTALFWDSTDGTNASNTANWDVGKLGSGVHPTDAGPDILKVGTSGNSPVDGTVTLLSGTVNIDKNVNAYGTLWITGTTDTNNPILNIGNVTLNFNVNMAVGKNDCSQLIVGNSTGSGRVNFGYDGGTATIDINPQGDTNPGHKWQILFFGSVTGTKNITLSPIRGYTMIWLPNPTNPTRLEIDN